MKTFLSAVACFTFGSALRVETDARPSLGLGDTCDALMNALAAEKAAVNKDAKHDLKDLYTKVLRSQDPEGRSLSDADFPCWALNHSHDPSLPEITTPTSPSEELESAFDQEFSDIDQLTGPMSLLYCERQELGQEEPHYECPGG